MLIPLMGLQGQGGREKGDEEAHLVPKDNALHECLPSQGEPSSLQRKEVDHPQLTQVVQGVGEEEG